MNETNDVQYLEGAETIRLTDAEVRQLLGKLLGNRPIAALQTMEKKERDEIARKIGR